MKGGEGKVTVDGTSSPDPGASLTIPFAPAVESSVKIRRSGGEYKLVREEYGCSVLLVFGEGERNLNI